VDTSSPAYEATRGSPNPTVGRRWIFQVQPTKRHAAPLIPPSEDGGYFKSSLKKLDTCTLYFLRLARRRFQRHRRRAQAARPSWLSHGSQGSVTRAFDTLDYGNVQLVGPCRFPFHERRTLGYK
jgi:hypothetical protein